jgi:cell division protease FtsH
MSLEFNKKPESNKQDIPPKDPKRERPEDNNFWSTNKKPNGGKGGLSPMAIWAMIVLATIVILSIGAPKSQTKELSYSQFKTEVRNGNVLSAIFNDNSTTVIGAISNDQYGSTMEYRVNIVREDPTLMRLLDEAKVDVKVHSSNTWLSNLFFTFLSPLVFVLFLYLFIYRGMKGFGKGAMSFGKSKARLSEAEKTTFKDVAGNEEAKQEVQEIIDFLKNPKKYCDLGARLPKGVLLVGNPGTGKTLLARAIAGEAGVPFYSLCGSDFVEMFVGVGAARVRDLFEQGKKSAPCIMFLDEIDAVGRHRGSGMGGGHDEREQTLNALLVELDGFEANSGVIMIAATNRPDVLDPALLRPGRFDREIVIDLPDVKAREAILRVHIKKIQMEENVDIFQIAKATVFFSGADLANLINEAALLAARKGLKKVGITELEESRDKVQFGVERKSKVVTEEDKRNTAWHEAGHTLVSMKCKHHDPLHKVTIIPRGRAAGMAMYFPEKDRQGLTRLQLLDRICVAFGGRAAEMLIFNIETTGASSDLKTATQIARSMVCEFGMSDMGAQTYGSREEHLFLGREISRSVDYSESTANLIDETIQKILSEQYNRAVKIIEENRAELKIIAEALLQYETLSLDEIQKLIQGEMLLDRKKINEIFSTEPAKPEPEKGLNA